MLQTWLFVAAPTLPRIISLLVTWQRRQAAAPGTERRSSACWARRGGQTAAPGAARCCGAAGAAQQRSTPASCWCARGSPGRHKRKRSPARPKKRKKDRLPGRKDSCTQHLQRREVPDAPRWLHSQARHLMPNADCNINTEPDSSFWLHSRARHLLLLLSMLCTVVMTLQLA